MTRLWARGAVLLVLTACTGSGVGATCEVLCRELVQTCDYQAFPSLASCMDGCDYAEAEGADIEGQLTCIQDAACDTFAVVECEHTYGLEQ